MNTRGQAFRPTTVSSHRVRLQYSEETRKKGASSLRTNHGSFPSIQAIVYDWTKSLLGGKSDDLESRLFNKVYELPSVSDPAPLPGDCPVKDYVLANVTPYSGDSSFLASPTERTLKTWSRCEELMELERQKGILDVDTKTASTITSHRPGFVLSKEEDVIYGLQTDEPLKRSCKPRGGFKLVQQALKSYGYEPDSAMAKTYTEVSKGFRSRKS
jgi:hypothetical protein